MEGNLPRIGPRKPLYQDQNQTVYRVEADFGSFTKEYFVTDSGQKAGIIAVQGESVLLVSQYRLLINGLSWEIPGGRVDCGETPELAALRECLEETGMRCLNPKLLLFYHKGLDTAYNPTYIFYSDQVFRDTEHQKVNSQEVSGVEWVSLHRCLEMIFNGQILDSFSIVGLLAYHAQASGG